MRDITVRLAGTGCFVDGDFPNDPFRKRLVLPKDNIFPVPDNHIAFVEFPAANIISGGGLGPRYQHRSGAGQIFYRRFLLDGHTVTIEQVEPVDLSIVDSYNTHVPKMTKVAPSLDDRPRDECFAPYPKPELIAAFFDVTHGLLKGGPLYEFVTQFRDSAGNSTVTIRTPEYVELVVPINSTTLAVRMQKEGATPVTIVLNADADHITIGNELEADISGNGSGDNTRDHFLLYYNLADPANVPGDPPLPVKVTAPVNSCTHTNWP
jgi:hypothetical protein